MDNIDKVVDFINVQRDWYVDELKEYLAIPSISALPRHAADVRRGAEWTGEHMRQVGLQNVRFIETSGNPVVYGDWLTAPDVPKILFYGHYDVQPVDPIGLWESPPFDATVRDGERCGETGTACGSKFAGIWRSLARDGERHRDCGTCLRLPRSVSPELAPDPQCTIQLLTEHLRNG